MRPKHRLGLGLCTCVAAGIYAFTAYAQPVVAVPPVSELAAAQPAAGSEEIVGVPVTLGHGITETVDRIMQRERSAAHTLPAVPRATHKQFRLDREPHEDPNAPPVSERRAVPWTREKQAALLGPASLPQSVATSFKAVGIEDAPYIPPDSMGDVGPTQIVVHINGRIRSFTKAGVADGALDASDAVFWASVAPGGITDPEVRYDRLSGRWILLTISIAEATNNRVVLAVSSGSTIVSSASFTFYFFNVGTAAPTDATSFCDYPGLGIDNNAIYTGCNMFSSAGSFRWTSAFVIRKSSVLSGGPIVVTGFSTIATTSVAGPYSPRGVDNDDPSWTEGYIIGTDPGFLNRINIRRVSTPGGTPTLGANVTLAVLNTTMSSQQASGSTTALDSSDVRLFAASIHKNKLTGATSLWTAQSLEVTNACVRSTSGATRRIGANWYEIGTLTTTPTLLQQGTLCNTAGGAPLNSARGFLYPTVVETGQGHVALSSSFASSTEFAGVAAAGRLRTDPAAGTRAPETIVQTGLAAYTLLDSGRRNRWGDYSFTEVDPTDDQTVWTVQEYADLTSACPYASCWSIRVVQLKAPPPPALASATAVCTGRASTTSTITGTDSCAAPTCTNGLCTDGGTCPEFFDPIPPSTSDSVGFANHITATVPAGAGTLIPWPTTNIVVPGSPATSRVLQMTLGLNTTAATAGAYTITITNPDGQAVTSGSAILTVNATPSAPAASNNGPVCAGATLSLSASTVAGATYSWTGPSGFTSTSQNPSIANATTAASGTYSVTVTVGGCVSTSATTTATVTGNGGSCGSQSSTTCDAPDTCGAGGVCQTNFATSGTSCGVAGTVCKKQDTCNGSGSCIDNGFQPTTTTCRASAVPCDAPESCTGSSSNCPADALASTTTVCRASGGVCDVAEHCNGTMAACPADVFVSAGTTCRASAGTCDFAESCTGTAAACPADAFSTLPCDDGLYCTGDDTCSQGSCSSHAGSPCGTNAECNEATDSCDPCARLTLPATETCSVGQPCTVSIGLASGGLSVGDVSSELVANPVTTCTTDCTVGAAAANGTCSVNSDCAFSVADITPPPTAFSDGEIASVTINCSQAGSGTLCIGNTTMATPALDPVLTCTRPECASYQCAGQCEPGDCNTTPGIDAGDPIAIIHCVVGDANPLFDCTCGADCNCQNGTDVADVICAVKRLIGAFSPDTCAGAGPSP